MEDSSLRSSASAREEEIARALARAQWAQRARALARAQLRGRGRLRGRNCATPATTPQPWILRLILNAAALAAASLTLLFSDW